MGKYFYKQVFILFFAFLFIGSCKTHEAMVPAYLYIKPTTLITKPDMSQGQATSSIYDVWLFDNEIVRGNFAINSLVPIQHLGSANLRVSAGIKYSGQSEQRIIYPMFNSYSKNFNLKENQVDTIQASFTYVENTVFPLIEDFDGNGFAFEYNPSYKQIGDTVIKDNSSAAYVAGKFSGKVELKSGVDNSLLEIYSKVFKTWPRFVPFYLEMDYKCNIPITIGLYVTDPAGNVNQFPIYVLNEISTWNKLYLDLQTDISSKEAGSEFRLFFRFKNPSSAPVVDPNVWLDNIKIVYLD